MDTHAQAHTSSQAEGRSMCSLPGERPGRPEPGHSGTTAITRASHTILCQLTVGGLFHMPGTASSLDQFQRTADAHLPKWEPLSGEGGGTEREGEGSEEGAGRGLSLGCTVFPFSFPKPAASLG